MKHMSVKKIVLCSIALFSALMMLIGLAFNVFTVDTMYSGAAQSVLNDTLGGSANGFKLMAFSFPELIETLLLLIYSENGVSLFGAIFGILSLVTLLAAIAEIIFFLYVLFLCPLDKWKKVLKILLIVNVVLVLIYAALGIILTIAWNSELEEYSSGYYSFGMTYMWVSLIFQAIALAGFIVCSIKLPDPAEAQAVVITEEKEEKAPKASKAQPVSLAGIFNEEQEIIDVLKEYKKLCDESIISNADFVTKKAKLLQYTENNVKPKLLSVQNLNAGVGEAEKLVIGILKQYKDLMDKEVLTSVEFLQKKDSLLEYIIH